MMNSDDLFQRNQRYLYQARTTMIKRWERPNEESDRRKRERSICEENRKRGRCISSSNMKVVN